MGHLAWTKNGDGWSARSHDGTEVKIYLYEGRQDVFAVEGRFGDKTYASATDATKAIANSATPIKTRRQILDSIKKSAEGYVLRYETTGIQDPLAANETIRQMNGVKWHHLLNEWRRKNPDQSGQVAAAINHPAKRIFEETRYVHRRFLIDTNRINSRQALASMNMLEEWCRRGVIEIGPHTLRHSIAQALLDSGMAIEELSQFLGHARIETTTIYAASTPAAIRESFGRAMAQASR